MIPISMAKDTKQAQVVSPTSSILKNSPQEPETVGDISHNACIAEPSENLCPTSNVSGNATGSFPTETSSLKISENAADHNSECSNASQNSQCSLSDYLKQAAESLSYTTPSQTAPQTPPELPAPLSELEDSSETPKISIKDIPSVGSIKDASMEAVKNGVISVVQRMLPLVLKHVTPNKSLHSNGSFLDVLLATAIKHGRCTIMEMLVDNGANPSGSFKNKTHLTRAILEGRDDVVETLVRLKADVNTTEANGKTPLHIAAYNSGAVIMNTLLEAGSVLEARDETQGNTPMHVSCTYCNKDAVMALFHKGAEFNAVNHHGDTPLSKLLYPITKADDFHNRSRMALAKELVMLGFLLPAKKNACLAKRRPVHPQRHKNDPKSKRRRRSSNSDDSGAGSADSTVDANSVAATVYPSKEEKLHKLYEKILQSVSSPLSLQNHCRLTVLRALRSRPLKTSVTELSLPRILQRFIVSGDTLSGA